MRWSAAWNDVFQNSGARLCWLLVGFGSTLVTARFLGPDGRGVLAAATTWVSLFTAAGSLSQAPVVMFIAAGRRKDEWLPSVVGTLLVIVGLAAACGWLVAASLAAWPRGAVFGHVPGHVLVVAFAALPSLLWLENGSSILIALGQLRRLNLALVVSGTVNIVLIVLLVAVFHAGVVGALLAVLIAQTTACGIGFPVIRREAGQFRFDRHILTRLLGGGAKLHLNAIGTFLVVQSGVLVLNHFRSAAETAYYNLALQLIAAIQAIPAAVGTVAYSIVSRDGPDAAWKEHRRLLVQAIAVIAIACVVAYVAAPAAVRILAGPAFLPTVGIFRTLLLGVVGMSMSVVMVTQWISRGFFLRSALLATSGGVATVVANWLVVPRYGAQGAAWVLVAICFVSMLVNLAMIVWVERRWCRRPLG